MSGRRSFLFGYSVAPGVNFYLFCCTVLGVPEFTPPHCDFIVCGGAKSHLILTRPGTGTQTTNPQVFHRHNSKLLSACLICPKTQTIFANV